MSREAVAAAADTIVVKVGTRVLTDDAGVLDLERIEGIAEQLAKAADAGRRVVLVSSGAVGAGIGRLGLKGRPTDLAQLQAAAAIGQSYLIEVYNQALEKFHRHAAQVLVTAEDLNQRDRYLNIRNTLLELFRLGAVPIVNENDTVRVDELQRSVGDNDRLAAVVTNLLRAPLLVLLSDVEGLYDRDPNDAGAKVVPQIEAIDDKVLGLVGQGANDGTVTLSTGGMLSKLQAARSANAAGENVIVANGRRPGVLSDILAGKEVGTLFLAGNQSVSSRKRWIGWTVQPQGRLSLDPGAVRAIKERGVSLLPVGVSKVEGDFGKGDVVSLCSEDGTEIARGLSNYAVSEVRLIQGRSTEEIPGLLGHRPYQEVVHRDNLTLVR